MDEHRRDVLNWYITDLVVSPQYAQDQTLVANRLDDGPYMSEDGGATWFRLRGGASGSLAAAFDDGYLTPLVASADRGVFRYRWPQLSFVPPALIGVGLDPERTEPVRRRASIPVAADESEIAWSAAEGAEWLSVSPLTGTLPGEVTLIVDPEAVRNRVGTNTVPAKTPLTLRVHRSMRYTDEFTVQVRAFFIHAPVYLPMMLRE